MTARPVPRGRPVGGHEPPPSGASRVASCFLRCMPSSIPRWICGMHLSLASPAAAAFPAYRRVGFHVISFEACSTFTRVTACTFAEPLNGPFHRRLRQLRYLHCRSDCYRLKRRLPGGTCTHKKQTPFHGARQVFIRPTFGWQTAPTVRTTQPAFQRTKGQRVESAHGQASSILNISTFVSIPCGAITSGRVAHMFTAAVPPAVRRSGRGFSVKLAARVFGRGQVYQLSGSSSRFDSRPIVPSMIALMPHRSTHRTNKFTRKSKSTLVRKALDSRASAKNRAARRAILSWRIALSTSSASDRPIAYVHAGGTSSTLSA